MVKRKSKARLSSLHGLKARGQVYNTTFIRWTTHVPKGLSDKDLKLALICDALAKDFGEVEVPASEASTGEGETVSCGIRGLADKAAGTAGDCCTPKK